MSLHSSQYVAYDGPLNTSGQVPRVALNTLRIALSFTWTKIILIFSWMFSPLFLLVLVVAEQLILNGASDLMGSALSNPETSYFSTFLQMQWVFIVFLFATSGTGAIADDERYHTFLFTFSKPVSHLQYLGGKGLFLFILAAMVSVVPAAIVSVFRLLLFWKAPFLGDLVVYTLESLSLSLWIAFCATGMMLGLSSLSQWRQVVTLLWIGSILVLLIFSGVAHFVDGFEQVSSLISPFGQVRLTSDLLLGVSSPDEPYRWIAPILHTCLGLAGFGAAWYKLKKTLHSMG